ncbi:amidase domain-containing protein [Nocardia sp. NBC_01499]|uniref:amidase domain-containing protein n=1 Tax=Nocardia sp. NBC_01499 TaxID=2903597 RepID=UPI003863B30F
MVDMSNEASWNAPAPKFDFNPKGHGADGFKPAEVRWAESAVDWGNEAGIDPRLVMATLFEEGARNYEDSKAWRDHEQDRLDFNWVRKHEPTWSWLPHGLQGNPEGNSLGLTNIKEPVFDILKKEYPDKFGWRKWEDLATDQELDIEATAYVLKHYKDKYAASVSPEMRKSYSLNEFLAAAYNAAGEDEENIPIWLSNNRIGDVGTHHYKELMGSDNWLAGQTVLASMYTWAETGKPISASPDQPNSLLGSWLGAVGGVVNSILRPARGPVQIADEVDANPNRRAAVKYADDWAVQSNWVYPSSDGDGGDCTDYVSQVLHSGGFQYDPSRDGDNSGVTDRWHPYIRGKYDHYGDGDPSHPAGDSQPGPWLAAKGLLNYIQMGYGNQHGGPTGTELPSIEVNPITGNPDPRALTNAGLRPGDIVFVDFGQKKPDGQPEGVSHAMVYAGHGPADLPDGNNPDGSLHYRHYEDADYVDYHSSNKYHRFWAIPYVNDKERVVTGQTVTYHPVHMRYPGDDQPATTGHAAGGSIGSSIAAPSIAPMLVPTKPLPVPPGFVGNQRVLQDRRINLVISQPGSSRDGAQADSRAILAHSSLTRR